MTLPVGAEPSSGGCGVGGEEGVGRALALRSLWELPSTGNRTDAKENPTALRISKCKRKQKLGRMGKKDYKKSIT